MTLFRGHAVQLHPADETHTSADEEGLINGHNYYASSDEGSLVSEVRRSPEQESETSSHHSNATTRQTAPTSAATDTEHTTKATSTPAKITRFHPSSAHSLWVRPPEAQQSDHISDARHSHHQLGHVGHTHLDTASAPTMDAAPPGGHHSLDHVSYGMPGNGTARCVCVMCVCVCVCVCVHGWSICSLQWQ